MKRTYVVCACVWLMGCLPMPTHPGEVDSDASTDAGPDVSTNTPDDAGRVDASDGGKEQDASDAADAADAADAMDSGGVEPVMCAVCPDTLECQEGEACGPNVCVGACDPGDTICLVESWDLTTFDDSLDQDAREQRFFGHALAMTPDGQVVAVTTGQGYEGEGFVAVRDACDTLQVIEEATPDGMRTPNGTGGMGTIDTGYGDSIALSADGLTLAIGERFWEDDDGKLQVGRVFIYKRGSRDEEFARGMILAPPSPANTQFGTSLALSPDGSILLVTSLNPTNGTSSGTVSAWSLASPNPTLLGKAMRGGTGDWFGRGLAVSWQEELVAVGATRRATKKGAAFIIDFDPNWSSATVEELPIGDLVLQEEGEAGGNQDVPINGSQLGSPIAISPNGDYIAAGAPGHVGGQGTAPYRAGRVVVWKRVNGVYGTPRAWAGPSNVASSVGGSLVVGDDGVVWASAAQWGRGTVAGIRFAGPGALFRIDSEENMIGSTDGLTTLGAPDYVADFVTNRTLALGTQMMLSDDGRTLVVGAQSSNVGDLMGSGATYVFGIPEGSSN